MFMYIKILRIYMYILQVQFKSMNQSHSGLKQGDTLSLTLFGIFINDIVREINDLNLVVKIGNKKKSILLYTDEIILLSDIENG